jgi:hypothetical protein
MHYCCQVHLPVELVVVARKEISIRRAYIHTHIYTYICCQNLTQQHYDFVT